MCRVAQAAQGLTTEDTESTEDMGLPVVPRCPSRKLRFLLRADAVAKSQNIAKNLNKKQKPYKCPHCRNWHLTTEKE